MQSYRAGMTDLIVFFFAAMAVAVVRALGPRRASNFGGAVARAAGPWLAVSRVAERNLCAALPELSRDERKQVVREVWENLGRTVAELPHLGSMDFVNNGAGFAIEGAEHIVSGPAVYVSAHYGNWEALPAIVARQGVLFSSLYRAARNQRVDMLISRLRHEAVRQHVPLFPKGVAGARAAARHLARGQALGMLIDQKLDEGLELPFVNLPAKTSVAAATLALHYNCPIILGRIERDAPARLRLIVEPPIIPQRTDNRVADVERLTRTLNDRISGWIKANPGSWLWLHRRWSHNAAR